MSRGDVEKAVRRYQAALTTIGIPGRATIQWGSRANGESHQLVFQSPDLQHPEVESIGRTLREAERYLEAMAAQAEFTARAMKRRAARITVDSITRGQGDGGTLGRDENYGFVRPAADV